MMQGPGRAAPLVIAHRGVHSTGATENTVEACELAAELGADMIELDVRRSGAGELALLHDPELDGVALDSCSLEEFERRTGFRPPLLAEVLSWAKGRISLDIELKEDGYVDDAAHLLAGFAAAGGELIVTSFIERVLGRLTHLVPHIPRGLLLEGSAKHAAKRARACGASILLPEMSLIDEGLIATAAAAGLAMTVWDFIASEHASLLSHPQLDGVITDDVSGALEARAAGGRATTDHPGVAGTDGSGTEATSG